MDTRTLCLAVLADGPATGYEIKKMFEEHFGYFLDVSHSAIYPALAEMREQGLLDCEEVRQAGKPDKKVYRLTVTGSTALAEGLQRSPGRHRVRSEFVSLLIFAEYLPGWRLAELIDERLAEWHGMLELAQCPPGKVDETKPGPRFAMGLCDSILRAGIEYLEHNRHWLESVQADGPAAAGESEK